MVVSGVSFYSFSLQDISSYVYTTELVRVKIYNLCLILVVTACQFVCYVFEKGYNL